MTHVLERLGRLTVRHPWRVIATWVAGCLVVIGAAAGLGQELDDSFEAPGLDSERAGSLLERAGADEAGVTADVVLTPRADAAELTAPRERAEVERVRSELGELSTVAAVAPAVVSEDARIALVSVQYGALAELGPEDLDELKAVLTELRPGSPLQIESGGDLYFAFEEPPAGAAEVVGLLVAVLVLLVAFGSVVAMGLPLGTALLGLAVGVGSLPVVAHVVDIPSWSTVMASMIGLGVGIDYSLFVLTRFREHLATGSSVEDAVAGALATAGRAVVFAGGTVMVAILGLAVARIPFVTAGGIAISLVVLVMVLAAVTLLPALLGLAGHRVNGRRRRRGAADGAPGRGLPSERWRRWGAHVGRHATAYVVGATALLLALAAPVTALQLGFPDEGTQPESRTERRAYDLVADGFGVGANGPLVVAVDLPARGTSGVGAVRIVDRLATAVAADPGVASVTPPRLDLRAGVAVMVALPDTPPQSEDTRATIDRLRSEVFSAELAGSGATAHVGGQVATFADLGHRVEDRLPWFVAAVLLLSFVLLLVVFRSLLVPLKAAVMNVLSVAAAYGVLVMVFQWGWGASLIGLESTVPVVSFIPMFMFAILFGLSMDYEVFLLSRVREEYELTGDNDEAVVRGLAGTARTITAAAAIMVSVFGGFVFGSEPMAKMLGLGLATAILIDATVVRLVLVPATMRLLGDANWWLPGWLDRLLPGGSAAVIEGPAPLSSAGARARQPV